MRYDRFGGASDFGSWPLPARSRHRDALPGEAGYSSSPAVPFRRDRDKVNCVGYRIKVRPRSALHWPIIGNGSRLGRGARIEPKTRHRCEIQLRCALWLSGLRYRVDVATLPWRPDIVFPRERIAVFCDGDFWHGRELEARLKKLATGHNAPY